MVDHKNICAAGRGSGHDDTISCGGVYVLTGVFDSRYFDREKQEKAAKQGFKYVQRRGIIYLYKRRLDNDESY